MSLTNDMYEIWPLAQKIICANPRMAYGAWGDDGKRVLPWNTFQVKHKLFALMMPSISKAPLSCQEFFLRQVLGSEDGETYAAFFAAIYNDTALFDFLIEYAPSGLGVFEHILTLGVTLAVAAADTGSLESLKMVVDKNSKGRAILGIPDDSGRGLAHYAAKQGHLNILEYLFEEKPVLLELKDDEGKTPLHYAMENEKYAAARFLIDHCSKGILEVMDNSGKKPTSSCSFSWDEMQEVIKNPMAIFDIMESREKREQEENYKEQKKKVMYSPYQ